MEWVEIAVHSLVMLSFPPINLAILSFPFMFRCDPCFLKSLLVAWVVINLDVSLLNNILELAVIFLDYVINVR